LWKVPLRTIGYARALTQDQDLTVQFRMLKKAGVTAIYREKISGARADRPQLKKMVATLRDDLVSVTRLYRLGRSNTSDHQSRSA
jgi:DNA invertase Pin-like site-specific DNA recombinase